MSFNYSDVLCGQLHCTGTAKFHLLSSMLYLTIDSHITVGGNQQHDCDSAIVDVGTQNTDPALAPDGASCGLGKVLNSFN